MPNPSIGSREARQRGAPNLQIPVSSGGSDPLQVSRWLEAKREAIADRWLAEIRSRGAPGDGELEEILGEFVDLLTSLLPGLFGPLKEQVEPLWHQVAELYGNAGALRGLASGEAIEEFQILREVLIRQAFHDPPGGGGASFALREVLLLNRIVDDGVTFAGVGHTDSLFFALFQGAGVPESPTPEVTGELRREIATIREELGRLSAVS